MPLAATLTQLLISNWLSELNLASGVVMHGGSGGLDLAKNDPHIGRDDRVRFQRLINLGIEL